jgi:hypothetical protein
MRERVLHGNTAKLADSVLQEAKRISEALPLIAAASFRFTVKRQMIVHGALKPTQQTVVANSAQQLPQHNIT